MVTVYKGFRCIALSKVSMRYLWDRKSIYEVSMRLFWFHRQFSPGGPWKLCCSNYCSCSDTPEVDFKWRRTGHNASLVYYGLLNCRRWRSGRQKSLLLPVLLLTHIRSLLWKKKSQPRVQSPVVLGRYSGGGFGKRRSVSSRKLTACCYHGVNVKEWVRKKSKKFPVFAFFIAFSVKFQYHANWGAFL